MYERFTKFTSRARKVMQLALYEARRLNRELGTEHFGTEHLLLGLAKEGSGVAANALKNLDIDLTKLRTEIKKLPWIGPSTMGQSQDSPIDKAIDYSREEAGKLKHDYIGTEHLLLGLLREDGTAAKVLTTLGLSLASVRTEVLNMLGIRPGETMHTFSAEMTANPEDVLGQIKSILENASSGGNTVTIVVTETKI
ncbi:MAG: ATPase domain protein [Candidatus Peribacteria bacterium]|nr:ATPase domain protein [Candidatus Peribacteria bacterium]